MQIFILVDKKDVCSKHTWATLVEEYPMEQSIRVAYFPDEKPFELKWEEYLTWEEYMDAIHNYKVIEE